MSDSDVKNLAAGSDVVDADGDRIGSVIAIGENYIVVERGFFFPTDSYIPNDAIESAEDGVVRLRVTKDEAADRGWEVRRADEYGDADLLGRAE